MPRVGVPNISPSMYTVTLLNGAPSITSAAHPFTATESDCPTVLLPVTLSTARSMWPNGGVGGAGPAVAAQSCQPGRMSSSALPNQWRSPSRHASPARVPQRSSSAGIRNRGSRSLGRRHILTRYPSVGVPTEVPSMYTFTLLKGAPSVWSATHPRITTESDCPTVLLPVTLSTADPGVRRVWAQKTKSNWLFRRLR